MMKILNNEELYLCYSYQQPVAKVHVPVSYIKVDNLRTEIHELLHGIDMALSRGEI